MSNDRHSPSSSTAMNEKKYKPSVIRIVSYIHMFLCIVLNVIIVTSLMSKSSPSELAYYVYMTLGLFAISRVLSPHKSFLKVIKGKEYNFKKVIKNNIGTAVSIFLLLAYSYFKQKEGEDYYLVLTLILSGPYLLNAYAVYRMQKCLENRLTES